MRGGVDRGCRLAGGCLVDRDAESRAPGRVAARWHVAATRNFRIYSYGTRPLDAKLAAQCESLRSEISRASVWR